MQRLIDRLVPLLAETSKPVYMLTRQSNGDVLIIYDLVVWLIVSERNPRTPRFDFCVTEWHDRMCKLPANTHIFLDEWAMKVWIIGKLRGLG